MIQLYNDYVILNDELQWILAKDKKRIDKKTNRPRYDAVGYFRSPAEALEEFRRRNIHAALKNAVVTLNEAIATIKNEDARLEKFIQDNIPDA